MAEIFSYCVGLRIRIKNRTIDLYLFWSPFTRSIYETSLSDVFYSYACHIYNEVVTLSFLSFLKISVFSFQHSFRCCRLIVLYDFSGFRS